MSGPGNLVPSGTSSYNPTASKIITRAFRIMGVINDEEIPNASQFEDGLDTLQAMMKELEATGIHVWTEEEAILFLQQNQVRYLLGSPPNNATPDHCADANAWILQQLGQSAGIGATSVVLNSAEGINLGDQFGVVLNTGAAFWTTVKAQPVGSVPVTVMLNAALPSPANAGNFAFDYKTNIVRPLRVPFARRLQYATGAQLGGIITPLSPMMSRREYFDLPQPRNRGTVTQAYYNPARDQGQMYVWNAPTDANNGLRFTYYRPIQDFSSVDDTADLPQEWDNALKWNLARELGPGYSIPVERWDRIVQQAGIKLELVQGWDRESESVYFGRSSSQTRG